jgi:tetratricopeptide (TPR) repeat protein
MSRGEERRRRRRDQRRDRQRRSKDDKDGTPADAGAAKDASKETDDGLEERLMVVGSIIEERRARRTEIVLGQHEFTDDAERAEFLKSDEFKDELASLDTQLGVEEKAQDLAFEAMEATEREKAIALAKEALALDPDCVDARLILATEATTDPDEYVTLVYRTVLAGERWLGDDFYDDHIGRFWHVATTRPYMRSMLVYGTTLWEQADLEEAVAVFEDMIELNPDDHQGARFFLVGIHLQRRDLELARDVLRSDPDSTAATFLWGRVFERILAGDEDGAKTRLENARQWAPLLERWMLEKEAAPEDLSIAQARTDQGDAFMALRMLMPAIETHAELKEWLRGKQG